MYFGEYGPRVLIFFMWFTQLTSQRERNGYFNKPSDLILY